MPTMSTNNRSLVLISLVAFLWFRQVSFAQLLNPEEADALHRIAATLGATLANPTVDPCKSGKLNVTDDYSGKEIEINITCNYNDGNFSHVTNISLKSMSLQGRLPPELVKLTFLQEIDLTRNYLSGGLPKQWTSLQHLDRISLTANRLSGEIPSEWGYFTNLTYLSLEANQLNGTIPEELGNLVTLTDLILSSNQFVGSLPVTLANLTNLKDFRISDNRFNGTVPDFIGRWSKLERLEMYSSGLEGPIDPTIFDLGSLTDLRIADMFGPKFDFPKPIIKKKMRNVVLRNLNMSGYIPTDIWEDKVTSTLDLTFNKLEGGIDIHTTKAYLPEYMLLSGNMLSGTIPESILSNTDMNFDISYNNFTSPANCPDIRFGLQPCHQRSSCQKYYDSIHINCGGPDVFIHHTRYEGDNDTENGNKLNYDSGTKWGFISAGDFMDDNSDNNADRSVVSDDTQPELYSKARASPLFITYYGYCLDNGNYTVNLHFMEIIFRDEEPYYRVGKRIFDIYIQGIRRWKDFNIVEQANGTGKAIIIPFNAMVRDNTLDIRLYWAGKGTTVIPRRGIYGPLISAISVCRGFNATTCDEPKKTSYLPIVIGVVASMFCLIFSIMVFFCWRRYTRHKSKRGDLKGLDLQTGTFTFRQLKAATNNFNSADNLGEGGSGSVYKVF